MLDALSPDMMDFEECEVVVWGVSMGCSARKMLVVRGVAESSRYLNARLFEV